MWKKCMYWHTKWSSQGNIEIPLIWVTHFRRHTSQGDTGLKMKCLYIVYLHAWWFSIWTLMSDLREDKQLVFSTRVRIIPSMPLASPEQAMTQTGGRTLTEMFSMNYLHYWILYIYNAFYHLINSYLPNNAWWQNSLTKLDWQISESFTLKSCH